MAKCNDLHSWMKAPHLGNFREVNLASGQAFIYRWTQNGLNYSHWFPVGTPLEMIHAKILEIELDCRNKRIRQKMGLDDLYNEQKKTHFTLRQLGEWYLELAKREGLAKTTIYLRHNALQRLMRFIGDNYPATNITRKHLNDFKRELLITNAPSGARILLSKLASIFKKAYYEDKIIAHPFVGFEYPRGKKNQYWPVMTPDEMFELDGFFQSKQMRLAWQIARFTGIRPNSLNDLEAQNITEKSICFYVPKLKRFEEVLVHPNLRPYIENIFGRSGRIFNYRYWGSIDAEFGAKIKKMKGQDFRPSGGYTPRRSLGSWLYNQAKWPFEDIKLFLTHHRNDVTWLYVNAKVERIRPLVDALPFK